MSAPAPGRLGRRLNRILLMLPFAIRHPGVSVDDLSMRFGIKRRDLIDDLELLFMCGLPGYGPGDLIDVELQEDRVFIRMADYFRAPLKLTPAEGLALLAGGEAIAGLQGMEQADSLRRALAKLRAALGAPDGDETVEVRFESPDRHLAVLQEALDRRRRVHIEYMSASRGGELTERDVDPWLLVATLGRWYLVGFDHLRGEERMFRVDRMKSVSVLEEASDVPGDLDPTRYKGAYVGRGDAPTATFEISPGAARWFEDYYPVTASETLDDSWRRVTLEVSSDRWIASVLVGLGPDARNVQPDPYEEAARTLAAAIASRYEAG